MELKRLFIWLGTADWDALRVMARRENRDPKRQAARLICEGLARDARRVSRTSATDERSPDSEAKR